MIIEFERLHDVELIRKTIVDPSVYKWVADDLCPQPEHFIPPVHPAVWFVGAWHSQVYLGLWMLAPSNSICWEVHTCLLPEARGVVGLEAACQLSEYMWKNSECRRIITSVPVFNRLALRFAEKAGMSRFGINPSSFLKNGILHDQILLGLSKPEDQACQQRH